MSIKIDEIQKIQSKKVTEYTVFQSKLKEQKKILLDLSQCVFDPGHMIRAILFIYSMVFFFLVLEIVLFLSYPHFVLLTYYSN